MSQAESDRIPNIELVRELHRVANEHGEPVSKRDMQRHGEYSFMTYVKRFGTWNNAVEQAGLEANQYPAELTIDELLTELERLADDLGRVPTTKDMEAHGKYTTAPYYNRFETWSDALNAAELNAPDT